MVSLGYIKVYEHNGGWIAVPLPIDKSVIGYFLIPCLDFVVVLTTETKPDKVQTMPTR